jgi:hypothetical protein
MLTWLSQNAALLNVVVNAAMLFVWVAYLQLFLVSFRRANRAVMHIDMAAQQDEDARCLVANMGSDAVYVIAVKVDLQSGEHAREALVTDRLEDDGPLGGNFREKTNQGPLKAGEVLDIGSFDNIVTRAARRMGADLRPETCNAVEITVVVAAQQAHRLMGGYKRFEIARGDDGRLRFNSPDVLTRQITTRRRRRQLIREITY